MKYIVLAVALLAAPSQAGEIIEYAAPSSVAVSSNAYVSVISSVTRNGYPTIIVKNPSSNATLGEVFGHVGGCTSTAVSTSSVLGPFSFNRGDDEQEIDLTEASCLWVASRSTQTITIQAIRRKK